MTPIRILNFDSEQCPYKICFQQSILAGFMGSAMKTKVRGLLATVLLISSFCAAQSRPEMRRTDSSQAGAKVLIVFGRVSNDARTLVTDLDSEWKVANASMLRGYEDRLVRIRCYIDAEKNQIQILSIKKENGGETYAAHYADSAFRR